MSRVTRELDTADLLARFWGLDGCVVRPLGGGMNSETWLVEHQGVTYVAKQVAPTALDDLVSGCSVASHLAGAGFVTGTPIPTADGRLVLTEHALALLEHVPGRELTGDTDEEQRWMASTLAGVHVAGVPAVGPRASHFMAEWLEEDQRGLAAHRWLVEAAAAARAETDRLDLTWSFVHTDPAPEAFLHDDTTGLTALIDWAGARRGPVLYDVASAVMYLGGTEHASAFLDTYRALGPLETTELQQLDSLRRFREVVQGAYFARRLANRDLTGGIEVTENQKGLDDARRRLRALTRR